MSDEDDDLFADSDSGGDTDDLIAESKSKPIAKPKKIVKKSKASASGGGQKRKRVPGMSIFFILFCVCLYFYHCLLYQ